MAGHSKWKNIRLHKGKADLERAKVFGRLSREITIAARNGGDPDGNPRLRVAIQKARESAMPQDNIKRAVQKGTGELSDGAVLEEVTYEGYGPSGVAVLVETATDNRNRTVGELRNLFSKSGGNLGESGSVAWQFARRGVIEVSSEGENEEAVMEAALEAGADDFSSEGNTYEITTPADDVNAVAEALRAQGFSVEAADVQMLPSTTVQIEGDAAKKMLKLMDALEDQDDVQRVSANFDIPEAALEAAA